jgi:hypothetical protein
MRQAFRQRFGGMREEARYIPINFVKDLRRHSAAIAAMNFWGTPATKQVESKMRSCAYSAEITEERFIFALLIC